MNIVIFNWRDSKHPKSGGAEYSTATLSKGLARLGHNITLFTSKVAGEATDDYVDGYRIIRRGNEITCRMHAAFWFRSEMKSCDIAIDEVNTLPFLTPFFFRPVVLWIHQLAREVWLKEAPPFVGHLGYAAEPLLMRPYRHVPAITVSASSAESLLNFGFAGELHVVENALRPPVRRGKPVYGRIGYVGRLAASKRIDHIIKALAIAKRRVPEAHLLIVGTGAARDVHDLASLASKLGVSDSVKFCGRLPDEQRDEVMASLDVLTMASVREGWGLVVSEAARFSVPSAVYPVAGLVDSVKHESTGFLAANETPEALADVIVRLVTDRGLRDNLGHAASSYIEAFTEDRFVMRFEAALQNIVSSRQIDKGRDAMASSESTSP